MVVTAVEPSLELRRLDGAYRQAWKRLRAEVETWQSLQANAVNGTAVEAARERVACAEAFYREHRNKLADSMLANSADARVMKELFSFTRPARETSVAQKDGNEALGLCQIQVRRLAYQFWEEGGRRSGSADADWYRAEALTNVSLTHY
jgi:hypothetical protein